MDFSQIGVLLGIAAIFGIVAKRLKQPLLVGYLLAGLLASYFGLLTNHELFESLGQIGVALLLFLVGLEMGVDEVPAISRAGFLTGIGQIILTFFISLFVGLLLNFDFLSASYIAIATTFSSTIIVIKLLSEKNDLDSLYGKISIGILLVQDLFAILILMFLAGLKGGRVSLESYFFIVVKVLALFLVVWVLSKKVLPYIFEKYVSLSSELLFIVSIAWALGLAGLVAGPLNLSLEIGGFLAGLALSNLPEHLEIASRTRPLRDFFLTLFFLTLGASLVVEDVGKVILPAAIFSLLVLVGHPLVVMIVMGFLRFKKRTSFLTSVTVAQISEFSLIIMAMGVSLGHVAPSNLALVVLVAAITMTISSYLILGTEPIYFKLRDKMRIFERKKTSEPEFLQEIDFHDHIVLIGCGRAGKRLISLFEKNKTNYLVIDFDPSVYTRLIAEKKPILFGDISDPEIQDIASIQKSLLVISTTSNLSDNLSLLEQMKKLSRRPPSVFIAQNKEDALKLYEYGATYVVLPEVLAGEHLRHILASHGAGGKWFEKSGKSHFDRLIYT